MTAFKNSDEARGVDQAFRRLMETGGVRTNILSEFNLSELLDSVVQGRAPRAMNVYVTTAGDDLLGDGSVSKPWRTIQRAIDAVPDENADPAVINVGPGTFAGFRLDAKTIIRPRTSNGAYLAILGTTDVYTPTSGPSTGTVSGLVSVNSTGLSSFTIAGASWVADELKGKFLMNVTQNVTRLLPIVGNTVDTISFYAFTGYLLSGETVTIVEPKTIITDSLTAPVAPAATLNPVTSTSSHFAPGNESAVVIRVNNCGTVAGSTSPVPTLLLANLRVTADAAAVRIRVNDSRLKLVNIITDGPGVGSHIQQIDSSIFINGWVSLSASGGGSLLNGSTSFSQKDFISLNQCFFDRSPAGTGLAILGSVWVQMSDVYIRGFSVGVTMQKSHYSLTRCGFESCTTAIVSNQGANYTVPFQSNIGMNGGFFSNCPTGIELKGQHWAQAKFWGGSGNGVIARVKQGARFGFRGDFAPSGTKEFEMDQADTTYALVQAATPKVIRDSSWGSMVYESDANTTP